MARTAVDQTLRTRLENELQSEVAVVHLTYVARPDRPPWPITTLFDDGAAFLERRLKPDHAEYTGAE